MRNNNARKKWSQKQEIIIIDSAHEKLVRGTQTNLARPVVSATFCKLLAKEKPSHRFHPVGEIFLLRVVVAFSFWGLVDDAWYIGLAAGLWAVDTKQEVLVQSENQTWSNVPNSVLQSYYPA